MANHGDELRTLLNRGYRYALSLTHQPTEAEDLLHEACVSILRADGPWRKGYLFATIRHRWIDAWRRRERDPTMKPDDQADTSQIPDDGDGSDALHGMVQMESIERALSTLRPVERETLYLMVVEGYSAREVAELTGRPRNSVLSIVHRARWKLRQTVSVDADGAWR